MPAPSPKASTFGQHRIYLSLAPGIGATRRLMADAQRLVADGYDVGIAFAAKSSDLTGYAQGLRVLPLRPIRRGGPNPDALDLEAVLREPPHTVVLGNLAYQQGTPEWPVEPLEVVFRLRQAGINVWSTVYSFNLTTIAPIYERLAGLPAEVVISETVLEDSTELILVDPEPSEILRQLDAGLLMPPEQAAAARRSVFRHEVLEQLRAATHALLEIRRPLQDDPDRPRLMVCIGFNPSFQYLLHRAADLAHSMGAVLIGLHVRPPGGGSSGYELTMREHIEYAEELCHEVVVVEEKDIATAMLATAHDHNVTGVVIGRPMRSRWDEIRGSSLLTKMINSDRDIDIYVLGDAPVTSH